MDFDGEHLDIGVAHICDLQLINITEEFVNADHSASAYAFSYYVSGPLLTFFIIVGILGNAACLYVFKPFRSTNPAGTPPIYVYLFVLAVWDFLLLCASFLLYNLPELTRGSVLTDPNYMSARPYVYCATNAAHTAGNWVVVALGLERYFALCYPFKHRQWSDSGRRRAVYVVTAISVAGVLYSLPRLFEVLYDDFGDVPECVLSDDGTYKILTTSNDQATVRQSVLYRTLYKIVGGTLLYSVGPFLCLLIVSIRVSAAIRQQRSFQNVTQRHCQNNRIGSQQSPKHNQNANRDNCSYSINIMLVSVVVKLLFVHALPTGLDVAETAMGDENFSNDQTIGFLISFLTLLLAVNSSCNFFIYYVCSKKFRHELHKTCRCSRGFRPLNDGGNGGGWTRRCCGRSYHESYLTTSLTSTIIANENLVGRALNVDHV